MKVDRLHTQTKQLLDAGVNVVLLGGTRHKIKQLADSLGTSWENDPPVQSGDYWQTSAECQVGRTAHFKVGAGRARVLRTSAGWPLGTLRSWMGAVND